MQFLSDQRLSDDILDDMEEALEKDHPADQAPQDAELVERGAALDQREAALDERDLAHAVRQDREQDILAEAEGRDDRADARDAAADARDMEDTLKAFVQKKDVATGHTARKAAKKDRKAAKSDRAESADDRDKLTE